MSIDVNYYSFSPKRADKKWPHFVEDIFVLRKKYAAWHTRKKNHQKDHAKYVKKINALELSYEPRIDKIRKKIFAHFDVKDYIIPWIEWNSKQGMDRLGRPISATDQKMPYLSANMEEKSKWNQKVQKHFSLSAPKSMPRNIKIHFLQYYK